MPDLNWAQEKMQEVAMEALEEIESKVIAISSAVKEIRDNLDQLTLPAQAGA